MSKVYVYVEDLDTILRSAADNCSFNDSEWRAFRRLTSSVARAQRRVDVPWMDHHGEKKIGVIKTWRNYTGDGLKEAKDAVESYPVRIPQPMAVTKDGRKATIDQFVRDLRECGASVSLRPQAGK